MLGYLSEGVQTKQINKQTSKAYSSLLLEIPQCCLRYPASTKNPSVDEDFSVMYYNHSQAGFKYKNLEKSDEDTEHYAFTGKTIEVKGTKVNIHY
jgi:hypothetical protein